MFCKQYYLRGCVTISLEVGTTTCILLWLNIDTISHYFQDLRDTLHVVINYFPNQQIHENFLTTVTICA